MNLLKRIYNRLRYHGMYIIADARDNSITLSHRLILHMQSHHGDIVNLIDVKLASTSEYAIVVNPDIPYSSEEEKPILSSMQVNDKYHSVGFYAYHLQYMAMDYSLPLDIPVRMQVVPRHLGKIKYYSICH